MASTKGVTTTRLKLIRDLWGSAFRISRWYIPGHDGIDLPAKTGTPIRAIASGTVAYARDARTDPHAGRAWAIGGGNVVNVNLDSRYTMQYAHLDRIYVKPGQYVKAGTIIGTVGSTGGTPNSPTASFGASNAHLHFGVWDHKSNKMIEPTQFLLAAKAGWSDTTTMRPPDSYATTPDYLAGWGNKVAFPDGHVLTAADIDTIMGVLKSEGYFGPNTPLPGLGEYQTRSVLERYIGQPWTKTTQDSIAAAFGVAAQQNSPDAYLASVLGPFADIARNLSDPGLWVRVIALFVGIGVAGYGTINVLRATGGTPSNIY